MIILATTAGLMALCLARAAARCSLGRAIGYGMNCLADSSRGQDAAPD